MKFNIRKISAVGASILMTGLSVGVAAAANYPAPFVSGGSADAAVVYGQNAHSTDSVEAGSIQTDLASFVTDTGTAITDKSSESTYLGSDEDRIWLNRSLIVAKDTITKSYLSTLLADSSFSGANSTTFTHSVKFFAGDTAGASGSGRVIFAKQPTSSSDPVIGLSMGTSHNSNPLYNASVTMGTTTFNHPDSEGEEITLFGQKFTISSDTDTTKLVLLKEAKTFSLSSDDASTQATIGGETYTVELISTSDTAATIKVTNSAGSSETKEINEAQSKRVNGLDVAIKTADETNQLLTATIIAGASKLTLEHGQPVTVGETNDQIDGTHVYLVGGTGAMTELAVAVFAPTSSDDALKVGDKFVDPVFGSFEVGFESLSSDLDDSGRETITVDYSGDNDLTLTMTEQGGNTKTFTFAHNETSGPELRLADSNNFSIAVNEMANLSYAAGKTKYAVVGNEHYGRLLELTNVKNSSGTDSSKQSSTTYNDVTFKDVFTGDTYNIASWTSSGIGTTESIDGKQYTVYVNSSGTGENAFVQIKYPTSDSGNANTGVIFPSIETENGAKVILYEPIELNLSNWDGKTNDLTTIKIPDGDGYTSITTAFNPLSEPAAGFATNATWSIGTGAVNTTQAAGTNYSTVTVGQLTYNFTSTGKENVTKVYVQSPEAAATTAITKPGVIILENKDDNTEYHAVVVSSETTGEAVGVNDVLFSSTTKWEAARSSDSKLRDHIDWYGVHALRDDTTSGQKKVTITIPETQVYANLYLGSESSGESGDSGTPSQKGVMLVTDSEEELASVSSKNLIVVGGSCINSAAATLVGGNYCESDWTDATGVGTGQFLIKGYSGSETNGLTSKMALLVAGYEKEDTAKASTYLKTQTVDTSAGNVYSTASEEVITTA